jgi:hypothetical protein
MLIVALRNFAKAPENASRLAPLVLKYLQGAAPKHKGIVAFARNKITKQFALWFRLNLYQIFTLSSQTQSSHILSSTENRPTHKVLHKASSWIILCSRKKYTYQSSFLKRETERECVCVCACACVCEGI